MNECSARGYGDVQEHILGCCRVGLPLRAQLACPFQMVQYILGVFVYLWTDWVYAYYHKFPVCDEDTYQRETNVKCHTHST